MNAQESTSRLCVVTGASEGLGRALVHLLAEDGYRVLAVARRKQALDDLAREAPEGSVVPVAADLETPEGITSIVDALRANGGSLRMLVNNAGRGDIGPFAEADTGVLRSILRLNVEGLTILTRALIDAIESGGTILNVASVASVLPGPWMATYYASKSYVLSLGVSLAEELRPRGISVTTVCPGAIATGFQRVAGFDQERYYRTTRAHAPETVAQWAYRAARRKRTVAFYQWYGIGDWAARLLPRNTFARLMARLQRRRAPK
ncbi:MAG: SDR family NAD(P)-dependent oxidoreductase [Spirochaetaceae bacterium]